MAEKTTSELNEEKVKSMMLDTSKIIKQYVDKQDGAQKTEAASALAEVESKLQTQLDAIAKIDSEDGFSSLAERLMEAEKALKDGDTLVQVLARFTTVEGAISDLAGKITAVEEAVSGLDVKVANAKKAVTDLGAKVAEDIATAKGEVEASSASYTDGVAEELRKEINGGGEAVESLTKVVEDNKLAATKEVEAAKAEAIVYADSLQKEWDLSGALSDIEDLFGIHLESDNNSNAL